MDDNPGTLTLGSFTVHRLGFGTMQLTGSGVWGPPDDHDGAIAVLRRAVELGVDLLDTADSYGPDVAEELVNEALHPYPEGLRIATKAGFLRPGPGSGRSAVALTICAVSARAACGAWGWSASTCSNCTGWTPRSPPTTSSAC